MSAVEARPAGIAELSYVDGTEASLVDPVVASEALTGLRNSFSL